MSIRDVTIAGLDAKRARIMGELHPKLRTLVDAMLVELSGRFTPICGYRDEAAQEAAFKSGASGVHFGQSPHNFKPALAVDLVLHPAHVNVAEREGYPDLWDEKSPEAAQAWADLGVYAIKYGLERVCVIDRKTGKPFQDKPHVQLPGWRSLIPQ